MAEKKHSVTCPVCQGVIEANTEDELVPQVQSHAKSEHDMDLTREQVLEMDKAGKQ